ncbi:MAG: type II secretion system protein [Planctomycetaceae bacterium]|nr:type II secretion system protein [Planctomycetaceae bacterium]
MRHLNLKSTSHRNGFTMLELTVAASLLGMVFVVTLPLLKHVRVSRDAAQQRFVAQQEVANLMEQIAAPATEASGVTDESLTISPEAASHLHDAQVAIAREPAEDNLQQVTISLTWSDDAGQPVAPASLTAWFPVSEEMP